MDILLIVLGSIISILPISYNGYKVYLIFKSRSLNENNDAGFKRRFYISIGLNILSSIGFLLLFLGINGLNKINYELPNMLLFCFGVILFFSFLFSFLLGFVCFYYKHNIEEKTHVKLGWFWGLSFVFSIISFFIMMEGCAPYLSYPLVSGFTINGEGFHWTTFQDSIRGGLHIQFYALFILSGAIFVYVLSDHKLYKKYGKHGLLESTFYVAFPAGIIGARLWYVVGNWTLEEFDKDFFKIFRIWEGGLTIIGGAVFGIIVGVSWVILRKKPFNVLDAIDIIVPTILIAQAIGRWGNFFNHEVYGAEIIDIESCWYLPGFIKYQMASSFSPGVLPTGKAFVPLFFIEGILNITGYFFITYIIHKGLIMRPIAYLSNVVAKLKGKELSKESLNKIVHWLPLGACGGWYLIWYGVIRAILEPLRDPKYNMGVSGEWSVINAMIMAGLGVVVIILLTIYQYYLKDKIQHKFKKKENTSLNE